MLVEHVFDTENHLYKVEGEFCLSTSAVIELIGLRDVSQVPLAALEFAGHRGSAVHRAIQAYEEDQDVEDAIREYEKESDVMVMDTVLERMALYYRFRDQHEVKLCGTMEKSYVYRHEGTEYLIGGTPDLPCTVDGVFSVLDVKTTHPNSGAAALQDMLKWKCQLQSYQEILTEAYQKGPEKFILHLHPKLRDKPRGQITGFNLHHIVSDDSLLWDSAIRVAMAKVSHGFKLEGK